MKGIVATVAALPRGEWRAQAWPTGRIVRVALAAAVVAGGVAIYGPELFYTTSSQAILNARVVTVATPIEGRVVTAPPAEGTVVGADAPLMTIDNPLVDRSRLQELEATRTRSEADLDGARHLVETLTAQIAVLEEQRKAYLAATVTRLGLAQQEAQADAHAAEADAAEARRNNERKHALRVSVTISVADLDQAEQAALRTKAVAERAQFTAQRAAAELDAARNGVLVGADRNDVPYSQQRTDEFRERRSEAEAQVATLAARLAQLTDQVAAERARTAALAGSKLTAPAAGVVWRQLVVAGSVVARQSDLLTLIDCSAIYATAVFSGRHFDELYPGRRAVVHVLGTGIDYPATVVDAQSTQGVNNERFAAPLPKLGDRQVLVVLRLDDPKPAASVSYCDVGRPVEVSFPRHLAAEAGIAPLRP